MNVWLKSLAKYGDKRVLWVFGNGIASGFPWVIVGSAMALWLKDAGLSRSAIGYFGSIFAVYTFNFLWAPLVDTVKIPFLHKRLGQRRSWMLLSQVMLLFATIAISFTDPQFSLIWTSLCALSVTIAGATQDIAIDAYRIDIIGKEDPELQAAGAAAATSGWWTGYSLIGAVVLFIIGVSDDNWQIGYFFLAGCALCFIIFTLFIKEPSVVERDTQLQQAQQFYQGLGIFRGLNKYLLIVFEPLRDFFVRYRYLAFYILAFILLFKIGEAFLGRMSIIFYDEIGFSKEQIAFGSKLVNWWVTIIFSVVSGSFIMRFGLIKGLLVSGIAMAATNMLFAALAVRGNDMNMLVFAVVLDGFTSSFSTVAFVAFISYLTSAAFSATQYALMASLGNFGRVILASTSGAMVDMLDGDWVMFFTITTFMVLPSLCILVALANKMKLWKL